MKKSFFVSFFVLAFCMFFCCNPMKVYADDYYWGEYWDNEVGGMVAGWHSEYPCASDNAISDMPENFTGDDEFYIYATPSEDCAELFKNLKGEIGAIYMWMPEDASLQIGSEGEELYIATGSVFGTGNATVYADFSYLNKFDAPTTIYGNVENDIFLGSSNGSTADHKSGDLYVDGNVGGIIWYKTHVSPQFENIYYDCFNGSCTVTGTVGESDILTVMYDSALKKDTWQKTGVFGPCEAGVFSITDGVLSDAVVVTDVTPSLEYIFEYQSYSWGWMRVAYNAENNQFAFGENCTFEDVDGAGRITIYGASEDLVFDYDIESLTVHLHNNEDVNVVVNGDVKYLNYTVRPKSKNTTVINGDVYLTTLHYRYMPEYNLEIKGTSLMGSASRVRGNRYDSMGQFNVENKKILIDGNINPEIYLYTGSQADQSVAYQPVQEEEVTSALADYEVGTEVTVSSEAGDITLQKNAAVLVGATSDATFGELTDTDEFEDVLLQLEESVVEGTNMEADATPLCGVDINVNTYYENVETGDTYNSGEYREETITELGDGKELEFTIKIPAGMYDENLEYAIIREHVNADGSVSLEILEAVRVGDELRFSSNKFSTFLLVAVEETEKADPDTPPEPDVPDTPEEKVRAFVERMYTVALGRAAEEEGLNFYTQRLFSGDSNGACLAESFLCSPEFLNKGHSDAEYVKVLYRTFFDREPAAEEVNYWVDKLSNGESKAFVLSGFVNSYEFDNLCADYGISRGFMREDGKPLNPGIGRFAERLYTVVLERAGEKEGIEYWSLNIANGACTPKDAAKNFFLSPEYLNKNTSDEQYIKTLYRTFMDREPEAGGVEYWQNVLNNGATREQILEGFADSAEFKGIMANFGL